MKGVVVVVLAFLVRELDQRTVIRRAVQIPRRNEIKTLQTLRVVLLAPARQGSEFQEGADQRPAFSSAEPSPLHPQEEHSHFRPRLRRIGHRFEHSGWWIHGCDLCRWRPAGWHSWHRPNL